MPYDFNLKIDKFHVSWLHLYGYLGYTNVKTVHSMIGVRQLVMHLSRIEMTPYINLFVVACKIVLRRRYVDNNTIFFTPSCFMLVYL